MVTLCQNDVFPGDTLVFGTNCTITHINAPIHKKMRIETMALIIARKDQTSIACFDSSNTMEKKMMIRFIGLAIAIVLIVVGTSLMLSIQ
ncbi:MAG: hypothetical protein V1726_08775 [Methanobacteriota archaeon]